MTQNKPPVKKQISSLSILLVDDYKPARVLLRSYMARLGVGRVEEATDSIEALRLVMETTVNRTPFDAVFVSLGIREMNGLEFVRSIRQLSALSTLPLILISENSEAATTREALTTGINEFLLRPYEEETLKRILTKLT